MTKRQVTRRLQRGDRVTFHVGRQTVEGVVVEDYGALAPGRRQMVRVEVPMSGPYHASFDVTHDEVLRVKPPPKRRAAVG